MIFLDFGALWVFAYLLVGMLNVIPSIGEKAALAFAWALGLKSLILFGWMASVGEFPDNLIQTGLSLAGLVTVFIICRLWPLGSIKLPRFPKKKSPFVRMMVGILGVLFCISFEIANLYHITEADGIWYHIRGLVFLHEAGFDSQTVVSQFRQYPPFVPLLYAYLLSFGVEPFRIIFPFIYLCLLVIFYYRILAVTENQNIATGFTLVLGTTPYFWWHSFLPFLDLMTGFYYSIGALYWFSLIQKVLNEKVEGQSSILCSWALLSGTFFGLAAWSRLEFLLYNAIPLLILIVVLDRNRVLSKIQKNTILLGLAIPTLIFSTLWFFTLAGFESPLERRVLAVGLAGMGMWLLVLINLKWNFHLDKTRLIGVGVLAVVSYLALMLVAGPQSVSLGKALLITLIRSISVHAFYLCTLFLGVVLFFEKLQKLSEPKKLLGWLILFYPLVHFMIFSYSEPKWGDISTYLEAVLVHPGHSINLSDTRGMLAFYPILLFFIAGLPMIKRSFSHE